MVCNKKEVLKTGLSPRQYNLSGQRSCHNGRPPSFCPRVVEPDVRTIKSGTRDSIVVKITQIHLCMVFTPWKCKIIIDNKETVVNAMILGGTVFLERVLFS